MSSYMDPSILEFLREHPEGATATEIAQAIVGSPGAYLPAFKRRAVWKRCVRLTEDGVLVELRVYTRTPGGCQCSCLFMLRVGLSRLREVVFVKECKACAHYQACLRQWIEGGLEDEDDAYDLSDDCPWWLEARHDRDAL